MTPGWLSSLALLLREGLSSICARPEAGRRKPGPPRPAHGRPQPGSGLRKSRGQFPAAQSLRGPGTWTPGRGTRDPGRGTRGGTAPGFPGSGRRRRGGAGGLRAPERARDAEGLCLRPRGRPGSSRFPCRSRSVAGPGGCARPVALETQSKERRGRSCPPQTAQSQGEGHTTTLEGPWRVPSGSPPFAPHLLVGQQFKPHAVEPWGCPEFRY